MNKNKAIPSQTSARQTEEDRKAGRSKHHQWLTEDIVHPALAQQLYPVMALMRASGDWSQFNALLNIE
jgi:hypothetical protein